MDNDNGSENTDAKSIKTVVIELDDLIFTIRDKPIDDIPPNLVFEQKDETGNLKTSYLYFNQSYKPFLIFLCEKFEVIVYSRLKQNLLNQLLVQIKKM